MRKVILIFFCNYLLLACNSDHIKNRMHLNNPQADSFNVNFNLLNCLNDYIESFDTVRDTWEMPPIYLISFYLEGKDTLLFITGRKISPVVPQLLDNVDYQYVGYFFLKDRPVLIDDTKDSIGNCLYIKSRLQKDVESVGKGRDLEDFERHTLPIWIYKINNKVNLILVKKEKGVVLK
jgi:hypothetical protein